MRNAKKRAVTAFLAVVMSMSSLTALSGYAASDTAAATTSVSVSSSANDTTIVGKKKTVKLTKARTRVEVTKVKGYAGKAVKPTLKVWRKAPEGYRLLAQGKDYTVSYVNNNKAGTAYYTVNGKGKYSGSLSGSFSIPKGTVTKIDVKVSAPVYSGHSVSPSVDYVQFLVDGKWVNVSSSDYTATPSGGVNAGDKTKVVIRPSGSFKGNVKVSKECTVKKYTLTDYAVVADCSAEMHDWKSKTIKLYLGDRYNNRDLSQGTDFTVSSLKVTKHKGTLGTAVVTLKGKGNYKGTVKWTSSVTFTKAK